MDPRLQRNCYESLMSLDRLICRSCWGLGCIHLRFPADILRHAHCYLCVNLLVMIHSRFWIPWRVLKENNKGVMNNWWELGNCDRCVEQGTTSLWAGSPITALQILIENKFIDTILKGRSGWKMSATKICFMKKDSGFWLWIYYLVVLINTCMDYLMTQRGRPSGLCRYQYTSQLTSEFTISKLGQS